MTEEEFRKRTKVFALDVIALVDQLPRTATGSVIGKQLLRSGTSVGAYYRAACCARSRAEMISKLGIVQEEADESIYWLELLLEARVGPRNQIEKLMMETKQILSMVVASSKTLKASSVREAAQIYNAEDLESNSN